MTFLLLDYIINDKLIISQYSTDTLVLSDHLGHIVVSDEVVTVKQKVRIKVTHYKKHDNVSQFNHDLIGADWNQNFATNPVNLKPNIFPGRFVES